MWHGVPSRSGTIDSGATRSAGAPRRRGRPGRPGDEGQFLLLSGLFLIMGFVLFATTVTQTGLLERDTEREQRLDLVPEAAHLVATLDQALNHFIIGGELNTTDFSRLARALEAEARQSAARAGLFASVNLAREIPASLLAERCLGHDPDRSRDGVVVGWGADSHQHGIMGAVYEVRITDGSRSLRFDYYVELQECASDVIRTHASGWSGDIGILQDLAASHRDDALTMDVTEELDWDNLVEIFVHPTINVSSIAIHGWNHQENILHLDSLYTDMPSRQSSLPDNNWFRFRLDPPAHMDADDRLPNLTLEITGFKALAFDPNTPQYMYLKVYLNDTWEDPVIIEQVALPTGTPATLEIVLEELIAGEGGWSHDDIVGSYWELAATGTHHPSQKWNIDNFNMTGSLLVAEAYRMNVTLDWPAIPAIYTDHLLILKYRIDAATDGEGFRLEVRDKADPTSTWTLVHNMTDTSGALITVEYPADPGDPPLPNRPEFRIVDTHRADRWEVIDEDTVQIALLRIESRLG